MYMHIYGNRNDPAVVMLHPMGITAEKLYEILADRFEGQYHLLIPDMGNHGMEKETYISAQNEADQICAWLRENGIGDVAMLYGASMGAAVGLSMLSDPGLHVRSLYLDGAPVAKLGFIMSRVFSPVLIWQRGIYEKNDRKKLAEFIDRWGEDLNEHMRQTFIGFSDETIKNIARTCVQGNMVQIPEELQKHTFFEWGKNEEYAKKSPAVVRKLYPKAEVTVREGYNHCEYMIKENSAYIAGIEDVIQNVL